MAEEVVKKVIVRSEELPFVQFTKKYNSITDREEIDQLYYNFRYRVVSEDRNRFSEWSPIEKIIMPDVTTPFPYTGANRLTITKAGNPEVITAVWSAPGAAENPSEYEQIFNKITVFDVWIRWNNNNVSDPNDIGWEEWEYEGTVSSTSFSILKRDSNVKRIEFAVQVPTTEKFRDYNNNKLTLFTGISGTI